ncbi:MAG: zinc-binding dehydrogenase [Opitutaceae bacterium]|nr:zinc-binding dehydrogenase [Opitutaceae bacterium]
MNAVQIPALNEIEIAAGADPTPGPGDVLVSVQAAALNHRDLWIKLGQYAGITYPLIPGSDGAGVITGVGEGVTEWAAGDDVVINPSFDWGDDEHAQAADFSILGLPRAGTLAEQVVVPATQLAKKPAHLSWSEAAALPLAGLTAYRALFSRAQLRAGERVLISGIGGGVALFALQYAVAAGAEVWVTSSSAEKIDRAISLGAQGGFNYREEGWGKAARGSVDGFDVIMDSAGGEGFKGLIDLCRPGARVVFFGATRGDPEVLPMRKVFWKQISLLGTTMGSPADWGAMIAFVEQHQIRPIVSGTFALSEAAAAFDLMEQGGQFGKIVVTMKS